MKTFLWSKFSSASRKLHLITRMCLSNYLSRHEVRSCSSFIKFSASFFNDLNFDFNDFKNFQSNSRFNLVVKYYFQLFCFIDCLIVCAFFQRTIIYVVVEKTSLQIQYVKFSKLSRALVSLEQGIFELKVFACGQR